MANLLEKAYWSAFALLQARKERKLPFEPPTRTRLRQSRRVRAIIRHAYEHVPHYREAMRESGLRPEDIQTADDLRRIPLIDGQTFAADRTRFESEAIPDDHCLILHSTGTSGKPKRIRYDARALFLALAQGQRQRAVFAHFVGKMFGYSEALLLRPASVASQIRAFYEAHSWTPPKIDLKREVIPPGDRTIVETVSALRDLQPDVIKGYGAYAGALFREAVKQGLEPPRPKLIYYGGDAMAVSDRKLIETELGIPVLSTYQAVEALRIGFECEHRNGMHLSLDATAVRVVDDAGRDVAPGQSGHIVISNLTNRATVLLNYKLGDVVTLADGPCPCGRTLPRIMNILGRSDDLLYLSDGRLVHSLRALEPLHRLPAIQQVQIVQQRSDRFLVRAVPAPGGSPDSLAVVRAFRTILGDAGSIEVEWLDSIPLGPGGKVKAVISELEQNGSRQ